MALAKHRAFEQLDQDLDYISIGQKEGAKLVANGEVLEVRGEA